MLNKKKLQEQLKNQLLYCGLSKDDYHKVQRDAYAENFSVWKRLNLLIICVFTVVFLLGSQLRFDSRVDYVMLAVICYSTVSSLLFFFVLKPDRLPAQLMIYGSMVLLMIYALYASLAYPAMMAVTFIVMLVLLPMFIVERPVWMMVYLAFCIAINLIFSSGRKEPNAYSLDAINCFAYGLIGMVISAYYSSVRMKQFLLQHGEKEHLEQEKNSAKETGKLNAVLRKTSESLIEVMGDVVESRDPDSGEHINRVKGYTNILANAVMKEMPEYGLDDYTVDIITSAAALHDVGKISVPDAILKKPGKLTDEEFDTMKKHCEAGCRILERMRGKWSEDYLEAGLTICRHHHEKWDGKGYPDGLKGDEIPISAQIVSVADIFDALTTKRVYKDAYSPYKAFSMILDGECGAFSPKLMDCLQKCRDQFFEHYHSPEAFKPSDRPFELVSRANPEESFVLGFHDQDRTLRESVRLHEENSVLESLSEELLYVCYVDMISNEVVRFRADKRVDEIMKDYDIHMRSYERFDRLLNSIIVMEDYDAFRDVTERGSAMAVLQTGGYVVSDFRVRLGDGIHWCRMKISRDKRNPNAAVIGIWVRDEEHAREEEYLKMQQELAAARQEVEVREKLADRLAVIDCISGNYDYVCSLNVHTMEVVVYRAVNWIRDMFQNLEDIVKSPEVRAITLKGIIHPDDFERFNEQSRHENVMAALKEKGFYCVDYRAYKYGKLVKYQTRYKVDKNDPTRIVIGLHCTDRDD